MKKLIIIAAAAVAAVGCGNKGYVISGQIEGLSDPVVYIMNAESENIDSAAVTNGSFTFKGVADQPAAVYLRTERPFAQLYLENGKIAVKGSAEDLRNVAITGTPANDAQTAYNAFMLEFMEEYRAADASQQDSLYEAYNAHLLQLVDTNLDNIFGVQLYASELSYEDTADEMLAQIAKFSPELQQTQTLVELKELAEAKARVAVGQPYIDIVQNDAEGNPVALSSVVGEGKYVLVDFWASWCGPCMGEVPYLIDTYKTYHDKGFEIYGVSFDKDADKWKGAIADKGMNWIHVSDLNAFTNDAAKDYAVRSIPSNFLISPDGVIIASGLRGEALKEKIAELLAE